MPKLRKLRVLCAVTTARGLSCTVATPALSHNQLRPWLDATLSGWKTVTYTLPDGRTGTLHN